MHTTDSRLGTYYRYVHVYVVQGAKSEFKSVWMKCWNIKIFGDSQLHVDANKNIQGAYVLPSLPPPPPAVELHNDASCMLGVGVYVI